jgi:hypothetical protein
MIAAIEGSAVRQRGRRGIRSCGGVTLAGGPCTHPAGWQTAHPGEGRCREHDQIQEDLRQSYKKQVVETLRSGRVSLRQASAAIGVQRKQIWRWRQSDAAFNEAVIQARCEARSRRDQMNVALVKESWVQRLKSGDHSPAEIIFFLKTRDPRRWNDRRVIQHAGAVTLDQVVRDVANDRPQDQTGSGA